MNKFILVVLVVMLRLAILSAQDAASTPAASPDVETLREQVQSLTEIVKALHAIKRDCFRSHRTVPAALPSNISASLM